MGEVEEHRDNRKSLMLSSPFFVCLPPHLSRLPCRLTLLVHINFLRLVDLRLCLHICFLHHLCALLSPPQPIQRSFQPLGVERFRQLGAHFVSLRVRGRACTRLHVGVCVIQFAPAGTAPSQPDYIL